MLNFRFVIKMLGSMFILETFFMLMALAVSFIYKEGDFYPLLISCAILFAAGISFYLIGRRANEFAAGRREGMLVVTLTWTLLSLFGMLPFYLGGYINNITDAYFETMSGFTTTGASVLTNIEALPHGILFWRSLTQWQGGIGVVVFTVALLPIFGGGASQMFDAETTGITHERFRPRVTQVAKRLSGVYILLTIVLIGLLWLGPMNIYDAVNHALTTVSTGGYSTKNASVAFWDSSYIEYIVIIFMFIGSVNMTLLYFVFNGKPVKLFRDEEFRWFFFFVLIVVGITTAWLLYNNMAGDMENSFRKAAFQVVSIISSTGFATADYIPWGPFFWLIAITIMFVGGCAGSTSGGLKMGRFVILNKNLSNAFLKQTHPNAILPVRMNGHVVSADIVHRILAFAFVYIALILASCLILMLDGVGFEESIGATVSAISNVGPGLGKLGPINNYAEVPVVSKWFLAFLMMVGRLEIFTVLTILLPGFWKR
ncbi:trk system potassium uptake protein TrkH [Parabacteroides sp. PF5-5]|uniref:TrkH family potassium uptake protein n=1 Tax=unclassified Parabacteroides TaxID=2649774 RepID=UPI0024748A30|nr:MULTISPECIES: TrkH family potassium uptake protein [unclassified Parabacteroides]MDH6306637.1 trk system potassium uptake protein TrkH [Parabacteroides sp. PH5-39]MDH6317604.1 trk system potassium uptake protein TrkH [Parabacteroides sp. PF5-13]MDH6321348.1 trk system potassium uptake protein TrkH [Parabacteroides sp. PH5-13]MDH6325087.1 trk system potassium uptake protein TrkH [Parabacteroides sp. PH5-8]MDH6328796.1 trk system potassium uptake protein TrkH [Parabacteroides sp. PH5-41]